MISKLASISQIPRVWILSARVVFYKIRSVTESEVICKAITVLLLHAYIFWSISAISCTGVKKKNQTKINRLMTVRLFLCLTSYSVWRVLGPEPGWPLEWQEGYQARSWTHKKHPKHVFPRLKFASLNKYSSGIWHPKQVFFFFFQPLTSNAIISPLNKYTLLELLNTQVYEKSQNLAKLPKYVIFPKKHTVLHKFCMKKNPKYVRSS